MTVQANGNGDGEVGVNGADVTLTVTLPAGGEDRLNTGLAEATAGTVYAEVMETKFMGRRVK